MSPAAGEQVDVLVVGGGPVGLAAALHARRAGHDVLVLDRRAGAVDGDLDKACGEGLLPGALTAVQALGVDPPGHPLTGISYRDATRHADHAFAAGTGRGVRRTALHAALRSRALDEGVLVRRAGVRDLRQDPGGVDVRLEDVTVRARHVLACDGLHSTVRHHLGVDLPPGRAPARYGMRRHYRVAPWSDLVEVHWGAHTEAYVTPVADDLVGVAVLGPRGTGPDLDAFGELADRLAGVPSVGQTLGAGALRQRTRRRAVGHVLLVGDASGYVDALTGEGVRVGLAQAEAAVRHLEDPAAYERAWKRVTRDYRLLTSGLVTWAQSPLRRAIVPLAAAAPPLYAHIVERLAR
ncbi:FAD-dependent oxidoreductase [Cellulosimicrobium arenosum]|uniref:FAD-dependent monooxygenase n=1 Tax=Cellulosimicrobium arenosum TaxID=2708133 RepID=A0A927G7I3_9MICO|nr:FAD-dependent monooxygenase [Cellulosimicrobium arenosum]